MKFLHIIFSLGLPLLLTLHSFLIDKMSSVSFLCKFILLLRVEKLASRILKHLRKERPYSILLVLLSLVVFHLIYIILLSNILQFYDLRRLDLLLNFLETFQEFSHIHGLRLAYSRIYSLSRDSVSLEWRHLHLSWMILECLVFVPSILLSPC